jgi:DNA repair exonuclease SbcCD ATPase subunit
MRLKRLTLHGFKTFADKTVIEFVPGVTCIVGPNGSGKSNLLDALVWCLGEQKASTVRATRNQDVIFAGSAKRKPMGMAEVSLTVDNEDRFLPLDFNEVTVTRRVYRDGESEYFINKTACRLKDIAELFFDTGVGRGAYAIVSQSEIDAILSAKPETRRELFEEAAGIKKYRVRKREAERTPKQISFVFVTFSRKSVVRLTHCESRRKRLKSTSVYRTDFVKSKLASLRQTIHASRVSIQHYCNRHVRLQVSPSRLASRSSRKKMKSLRRGRTFLRLKNTGMMRGSR